MPIPVRDSGDLRPGDYYEDCAYHPCVCIATSRVDGDFTVTGVSLVDGSHPRSCGVPGCGVRRLTFDEAVRWKFYGPSGEAVGRVRNQWWPHVSEAILNWPLTRDELAAHRSGGG